MMKRIMIYSDLVRSEFSNKFEDNLRLLTGTEEVQIEKYSLSESNKFLNNVEIVFLMLPDFTENNPEVLKALTNVYEHITEQHLSLIPIKTTDQNEQYYPDFIRKKHILSMTDKNRNEKLLRVIQEQSNIFHELEEEATKISSGQIAMQDCTARQLFRYAVALLHGMGVQKNIKESLSLFRVLIGNDTFISDAVDISAVNGVSEGIFEFCWDINTYLENQIIDVLNSKDYRDAEQFINTCQLMYEMSACVYNFNADNAIRFAKTILFRNFGKDISLKAGKWLLNCLFNEADRATVNRYFDKAVDSLLNILSLSEKLWTTYQDTEVLSYLCFATYVLQVYRKRNQRSFEHIVANEVTDELEDNGTFRPPYQTIPRNQNSFNAIQILIKDFIVSRNGLTMLLERYQTEYSSNKCAILMMTELIKAANLLCIMKFACVGDDFSTWYNRQMNFLLSFHAKNDVEKRSSFYIAALMGYDKILEFLQNPYYHCSDKNIIAISESFIDLFDYHYELYSTLGLDKSKPYALISDIYEKQKQYRKADDAYLKLYEIVAERDKSKEKTIVQMLTDVYKILKKRQNANMQIAYEKYVRFAWNVCLTNRLVQPHICDAFMEEMQAIEAEYDHQLLSDSELILYRKETPREQKMIDIVYPLACKELYEILKLIDDESYNQISDQYILMIRSKMNIHYSFVYDHNRDFDQQDYLKTTRIMIRYLFDHFWNGSDDNESRN